MILVGELSLWVALLMATWGATVSFAGGQLRRADLIDSGERAIYATLAMVVLASIGLWTALLTHDFSIKYVASFTSSNLPVVYTIAAFWGGQSGSLLFWALILAVFSAITLWSSRTTNRELMPYVSGTLALILAFLLATICLGSNPFERLDWIPPEGRGLDPRLQNAGMALHPPSLYFGYIGTSIPFAFAIAALLVRRLDTEWLATVRRWTLFSWFFLTVGITLGMWWAYVELGRDRYWAWDPVANASLLPWLMSTAFLLSIMVQEKRGVLRKWNVTLVVATFLLSLSATFITRGGVISSVQSLARSNAGWWLAGLFVACIGVTVYLVTTRIGDLRLIALPGPVTRNRRLYGGSIAGFGVVVIFAAFAGMAFKREYDLTLKPGESRAVTDPWGHSWTFLSQGISRYSILNREVAAIALDLRRDGERAGVMTSEKRQYVDSRGDPTFEPSTEAGIRGSFRQDVFVVLAEVRNADEAELRVSFNPLVRWVWIGGALIALGGLVLMWPPHA